MAPLRASETAASSTRHSTIPDTGIQAARSRVPFGFSIAAAAGFSAVSRTVSASLTSSSPFFAVSFQ